MYVVGGGGKCRWEIMMDICMRWNLVVSDTYSTVHDTEYIWYRNL